jgi:hypothetical protein
MVARTGLNKNGKGRRKMGSKKRRKRSANRKK